VGVLGIYTRIFVRFLLLSVTYHYAFTCLPARVCSKNLFTLTMPAALSATTSPSESSTGLPLDPPEVFDAA